jgi:hypothetical protein
MCTKEQHDEVLSPKETIDLLMRKYTVMYSALLMRATSYTSHVRNSQIVATLIVGTAALAFNVQSLQLTNGTKKWWALLTLVAISVIYYIWYDTLDAHFAVVSHSARIKSLETQINKVAGRELLIWETVIAPKLWQPAHPFKGLRPFKGVIHPVRLMLLYQAFLMLIVAVAFPLYIYYLAWNFPETSLRFKVFLVCATIFAIASMGAAYYVWDGLNRRLNDNIVEFIGKHWEPDVVRARVDGSEVWRAGGGG